MLRDRVALVFPDWRTLEEEMGEDRPGSEYGFLSLLSRELSESCLSLWPLPSGTSDLGHGTREIHFGATELTSTKEKWGASVTLRRISNIVFLAIWGGGRSGSQGSLTNIYIYQP